MSDPISKALRWILDALGVYNEDYQNEEVVDDPDSFDQEDVCSPNYNPLDLFVDDMLFP